MDDTEINTTDTNETEPEGKEIEENESAEKAGNNFSKRVIGYGIFASGTGIAILGGMADNGQKRIITTGVVFALLGLLMTRKPKPIISKD